MDAQIFNKVFLNNKMKKEENISKIGTHEAFKKVFKSTN